MQYEKKKAFWCGSCVIFPYCTQGSALIHNKTTNFIAKLINSMAWLQWFGQQAVEYTGYCGLGVIYFWPIMSTQKSHIRQTHTHTNLVIEAQFLPSRSWDQ